MGSPSPPHGASVQEPLPEIAHVARQPMLPFPSEAREGGAPLDEVLVSREARALAGSRAAAVMGKRRFHDGTAPARLPHGKGQIAVIAVQESVGLVEPADCFEQRAPETEAHAVD